jgi:hypothetical protein
MLPFATFHPYLDNCFWDKNEILKIFWCPDFIAGRTLLLEIRVSYLCKKVSVLYINQHAVQGWLGYKRSFWPRNPSHSPRSHLGRRRQASLEPAWPWLPRLFLHLTDHSPTLGCRPSSSSSSDARPPLFFLARAYLALTTVASLATILLPRLSLPGADHRRIAGRRPSSSLKPAWLQPPSRRRQPFSLPSYARYCHVLVRPIGSVCRSRLVGSWSVGFVLFLFFPCWIFVIRYMVSYEIMWRAFLVLIWMCLYQFCCMVVWISWKFC